MDPQRVAIEAWVLAVSSHPFELPMLQSASTYVSSDEDAPPRTKSQAKPIYAVPASEAKSSQKRGQADSDSSPIICEQ